MEVPLPTATRDQIYSLVVTFYESARKDEVLGPVFNSKVADWPHHNQILTDFWSTLLLNERSYKGNPINVHALIKALKPEMFDRWLVLWHATVDIVLAGTAQQDQAHRQADNMARTLKTRLFGGPQRSMTPLRLTSGD